MDSTCLRKFPGAGPPALCHWLLEPLEVMLKEVSQRLISTLRFLAKNVSRLPVMLLSGGASRRILICAIPWET